MEEEPFFCQQPALRSLVDLADELHLRSGHRLKIGSLRSLPDDDQAPADLLPEGLPGSEHQVDVPIADEAADHDEQGCPGLAASCAEWGDRRRNDRDPLSRATSSARPSAVDGERAAMWHR